MFSEQRTQRGGDLPLRQDAGRALVQQRLEQVMLGPVDEGHLQRLLQPPGREQAGESAADDHHPGAGCCGHGLPRSFVLYGLRVGQPLGSCQVSRSGSSRSASLGPQLPRAYGWTGVTSPSTGSTILQAASTVSCSANSHLCPSSAAPISWSYGRMSL